MCYYTLLKELELEPKFIELSEQDFENLKESKDIIFNCLKEVITLENSKLDSPDWLEHKN